MKKKRGAGGVASPKVCRRSRGGCMVLAQVPGSVASLARPRPRWKPPREEPPWRENARRLRLHDLCKLHRGGARWVAPPRRFDPPEPDHGPRRRRRRPAREEEDDDDEGSQRSKQLAACLHAQSAIKVD